MAGTAAAGDLGNARRAIVNHLHDGPVGYPSAVTQDHGFVHLQHGTAAVPPSYLILITIIKSPLALAIRKAVSGDMR